VTPTLNVDLGPGTDSPAELFIDPGGTPNAASESLNNTRNVPRFGLPAAFGEELRRCRDCRAFEMISLAFATPLLLRFLSPAELLSVRSRRGLPLLAFSPLFCDSLPVSELAAKGSLLREDSESFSDVEDEPNILFSRPPWLEKLRRLASLTAGRVGGKGRYQRGCSKHAGTTLALLVKWEWEPAPRSRYRCGSSSDPRWRWLKNATEVSRACDVYGEPNVALLVNARAEARKLR